MLLVGQQKDIHPVKKTEWWDAGMIVCLEQDAMRNDMVQLIPLPLSVSYFSKTQIGFTFLVSAYPTKGH